jgi:hypothetical protein
MPSNAPKPPPTDPKGGDGSVGVGDAVVPLGRRLSAWRGARAFARQGSLLHKDLRHVVPSSLDSADSVVVLVHGMFATAGVFRPLRETLEAAGFPTASFTHAPGFGVVALMARLRDFLNSLPPTITIDLVGHSLGGVVARYYVQEYPNDKRVRQTVSLGGPFQGTRRARWMPGPAGRDLLPGSPILDEIQRGALDSEAEVPHLSIVAGRDAMITEPAVLRGSDVMVAPQCGHNELLFNPAVTERLLQQLRDARLIERHEMPTRAIIDPHDV